MKIYICITATTQKILERVRTCEKKKLIIDNGTRNEFDDQFAVAYALLSDDTDVLAFNAAPFGSRSAICRISLMQ